MRGAFAAEGAGSAFDCADADAARERLRDIIACSCASSPSRLSGSPLPAPCGADDAAVYGAMPRSSAPSDSAAAKMLLRASGNVAGADAARWEPWLSKSKAAPSRLTVLGASVTKPAALSTSCAAPRESLTAALPPVARASCFSCEYVAPLPSAWPRSPSDPLLALELRLLVLQLVLRPLVLRLWLVLRLPLVLRLALWLRLRLRPLAEGP